MVALPRTVFLASIRTTRPIPEVRRVVVVEVSTRIAFSKVPAVYAPGQSEGSPNARNRLWEAEQVAAALADLGRDDLKKRIKDFRGRFKLDFSDDYLDALSLDRLRHLLLAALINAKAEP